MKNLSSSVKEVEVLVESDPIVGKAVICIDHYDNGTSFFLLDDIGSVIVFEDATAAKKFAIKADFNGKNYVIDAFDDYDFEDISYVIANPKVKKKSVLV